jgi:DNA-binding MarR family transcriptional regulator
MIKYVDKGRKFDEAYLVDDKGNILVFHSRLAQILEIIYDKKTVTYSLLLEQTGLPYSTLTKLIFKLNKLGVIKVEYSVRNRAHISAVPKYQFHAFPEYILIKGKFIYLGL